MGASQGGRMWASAPTRVTGTRRSGGHAGSPLIPSCRGRRPRRPAFTARPAPAEKGGKGIRALPGPKVSPRAPRFIKATTRECQLSLAGGRRYALARTDPPRRFFSWTGRGPFVSGLSAAAHAAVGLRHAPAGAVFSARPNGVPARAQRSGSRGERRSKGSERSFRIGAPAAPCAVGRAGAAE